MATDIIGELSFGESFRMQEQKRKNQYILDLEKNGFMGCAARHLPDAHQPLGPFPHPRH